MPMGGFKNFAECLKHYTGKGLKKENAQRICGKIYWATEGKRKKHAQEELEKMDKLLEDLRKEFGLVTYSNSKEPEGLKKWRRSLPRGAIMKPEEFEKLVQELMKKGYTREQAEKIAGKIYWQRAEKMYKNRKK